MKAKEMGLRMKKIKTKNYNETKEILNKDEREEWDFIVCI